LATKLSHIDGSRNAWRLYWRILKAYAYAPDHGIEEGMPHFHDP
jgi:hypothetical protein